MIQVSQEKGRELLLQKLRNENELQGNEDEASLNQLVTAAYASLDGNELVPACPYCNEPRTHCRCKEDKEQEEEKEELTDEELEEIADALRQGIQSEGGELELEDGSKLFIERDGYDYCPVCDQQRLEELLVETRETEQVIGCSFCLNINRGDSP